MKTQIATTLQVCFATVLGLGMAMAPASAGVIDLLSFKLDVPTSIGAAVLPAGDYTVRDIQNSGNSAVLEFTSSSGHTVSALVRAISTPNGQDAAHSSIILRSEGGTFQVDKVWIEGKELGYQLITTEAH